MAISIVSTPGLQDEEKEGSNPEHKFGYFEAKHSRNAQEDALAWIYFNDNEIANLSPEELGQRLWTSYKIIDANGKDLGGGSTASSTIFDGKGNLITATLADAVSFAAIYGKDDKVMGVVRLNSIIHKPTSPTEEARIKAGGGHVWEGRVLGILAVSRAFGDYFPIKNSDVKLVSSDASIEITNIDSIADHLKINKNDIGRIQVISTCDGFTDAADVIEYFDESTDDAKEIKTNHEKFLKDCLEKLDGQVKPEQEIAKYLVECAKEGGSRDNISVAVQTLIANEAVLVGVYDGHNGQIMSHFAANSIGSIFIDQCKLSNKDYLKQEYSFQKKAQEAVIYNITNPVQHTDAPVRAPNYKTNVGSSSSAHANQVPPLAYPPKIERNPISNSNNNSTTVMLKIMDTTSQKATEKIETSHPTATKESAINYGSVPLTGQTMIPPAQRSSEGQPNELSEEQAKSFLERDLLKLCSNTPTFFRSKHTTLEEKIAQKAEYIQSLKDPKRYYSNDKRTEALHRLGYHSPDLPEFILGPIKKLEEEFDTLLSKQSSAQVSPQRRR